MEFSGFRTRSEARFPAPVVEFDRRDAFVRRKLSCRGSYAIALRERPVTMYSVLNSNWVPSGSPSWLVSTEHRHPRPPDTAGRVNGMPSWYEFRITSTVASAPRRRMPDACARPSSRMPRHRVFASSHAA